MKAHWACTMFRGLVNSYGITDTEMHNFFLDIPHHTEGQNCPLVNEMF